MMILKRTLNLILRLRLHQINEVKEKLKTLFVIIYPLLLEHQEAESLPFQDV